MLRGWVCCGLFALGFALAVAPGVVTLSEAAMYGDAPFLPSMAACAAPPASVASSVICSAVPMAISAAVGLAASIGLAASPPPVWVPMGPSTKKGRKMRKKKRKKSKSAKRRYGRRNHLPPVSGVHHQLDRLSRLRRILRRAQTLFPTVFGPVGLDAVPPSRPGGYQFDAMDVMHARARVRRVMRLAYTFRSAADRRLASQIPEFSKCLRWLGRYTREVFQLRTRAGQLVDVVCTSTRTAAACAVDVPVGAAAFCSLTLSQVLNGDGPVPYSSTRPQPGPRKAARPPLPLLAA
jgi:hypothetical protein